jgi:hypothetical protein
LADGLCCFEAVAGSERHPPRRDLLCSQLADAAITEDCGCLAEQVAELLDRHGLHIVLGQVRLNKLRERESARDPSLPSKPLELALESITRVLLGNEPSALNALRVAAAGPVAVRPQPLAVGSATR